MSHPTESVPVTGAPVPSLDRTPARRPGVYRWVPMRSLSERHRPLVLRHLLALPGPDRYLRFGYVATDEQVSRYVQDIDFERDEVFGVYNRRLQLVAMAHLAYGEPGAAASRTAEFGVSVASHLRGRGLGERLFAHAALHARNRGIDTLVVHALSENAAMLRIARHAGARVERDGPESCAVVRLAPESLGSRVEELVGDGAAGIDYRIKREARRVDHLWSTLTKD